LKTPVPLLVTTLLAIVMQAVRLPVPLPSSAGLPVNVLSRAIVVVGPKGFGGSDWLMMPRPLSVKTLLVIVKERWH
jgi:hypothetical protein